MNQPDSRTVPETVLDDPAGIDLNRYVQNLQSQVAGQRIVRHKGRVVSVKGTSIRITGLPARIGQRCQLASATVNSDLSATNATARTAHQRPELEAEVVGFDGNEAILIPLGELQGLALGSEVTLAGSSENIGVSESFTGRVLDGFRAASGCAAIVVGRPLDATAWRGPQPA